jgi:hypothetical protein
MRPSHFQFLITSLYLALCAPACAQTNARVLCGSKDASRLLFKEAETIQSTAKIPCGELVEVVARVQKNGVYEVRRSDGQTGYILADAIEQSVGAKVPDSNPTPSPAATSATLSVEQTLAAQSKMLADLTRRLNDLESKVQTLTLMVARNGPSAQTPSVTPRATFGALACAPAIESTISGDFNGWEGETIFKLDNGQIWEQAEYSYMYSYQYRPDVTIYQTASGCRLKVEDEDETILVRKLR